METKYYCRNCGSEVKFEYFQEEYICDECKKKIVHKDLMRSWVLDARISQLKAMHDLMCEANDEDIYMSWINTMPDCPSKEDLIHIAMDDKQYNECFDKFIRLIQNKGNRW